MRLLSLALERYGPFTDRTVRFREDARLHVVLGPNEAGKSTALAAITDLLFGIEKNTRYAFSHEMPAMRLGAEIRAADGRTLAFRRRKGLRNTLIDADEAALPEDALAPFLGGIGRSVFCRAFGLDAAALRAGGREMVDVEGEVGASLFAAGSGLRGLTELQAGLDAEAEGIFTVRRAGHRTFYQALDRHKAARDAIRRTELRAVDWQALNDGIAAAAGRLDGLQAEREANVAARVRLERLRRAGPILAEIDAVAERASGEAGLIEADAVWIERLGAGLDGCRRAQAEAARAEDLLTRARAEVEALPAEPVLTGRAEEILLCFEGVKNFEKGAADLPRVQAEADAIARELERLRARVGAPDLAGLEAMLPTDAARARLDRLIREGRALAAEEERHAADLAAAGAERDRLAREVEGMGAARDPAPLREAFRPFARLHDEIARHDALDEEIHRRTGALCDEASRLTPPVADTVALARLPLPARATIDRFRTLLDGKRRDCERAADRCDAAARLVAETRRRLRDLEGGRPVATRERLDALRAARAEAFAPLRDALAGGAPASAGAVAAYERALFEADALADERAADAARVATQAAGQAQLAAEEADAAAATAQLAAIEAEAEAGEAAWRDAWRPAGIEPGPPAEMAAWLSAAENLIEAEQMLAAQRIGRDRLGERIEAVRAPLAELCARAGLEPLPGQDIAGLLARIEARIAALAGLWEAGRETGGLLRAAAAAADRHAAGLAEAEGRHAAWREAWAQALVPLGLDGAARPEEAEDALAAWRAVPDRLDARADRERRVAGITRDMDAYRAGVAGLVAALAPDLADMPPGAGIRTLHHRLVDARDRATRRVELGRRLDEAAGAARIAAREHDGARGALRDHLGDRVPEAAFTEIEDLHGRLCARERLRVDLARLQGDLARAGDGLPEAELRAGLADLPPERLEAEIGRIALEAEDIEQRGRRAFADREREEARRTELEGGTGAEPAMAERRAAEADLQAAARTWAVLRIAGLMLGHAVARHRAGQQDPLVTRAGTLFRTLTGGAFDGLAQSYDAADTPRLAGQRAGGGLVPIEGLSEGTRDQLYLALRLAYLEDYAGRAEPAPFVADDLFSTFDDARTAHGLGALAEVGARVQPILFTHHRHVAEIAADTLGAAVDVIELAGAA